MSQLSNKNFGSKIYSRFPPKYREDDVKQNYALKRYLDALSDGGFSHAIEDINGITTLVDPSKVDAKYLPILFEQYGLPVFNGIPESYLRYLLPLLSEAYSQKGTLTSVEFVTSALAGVKVILEVVDMELNVRLEMDYNLSEEGYFPDAEKFGRIIDKFLPFYLGRNIIYVFVFYEEQILRTNEESLMKVQDTKEEFGSLPSVKVNVPKLLNDPEKLLNSTFILNPVAEGDYVDAFVDRIKFQYIDHISMSMDDDALDNVIIGDSTSFGTDDSSLAESIITMYIETPKIFSKGVGSEPDNDYSDIVNDKVTQGFTEEGHIPQFIESRTNKVECVLNRSFYTNGERESLEYSYDVVMYSRTNNVSDTLNTGFMTNMVETIVH